MAGALELNYEFPPPSNLSVKLWTLIVVLSSHYNNFFLGRLILFSLFLHCAVISTIVQQTINEGLIEG